MLVGVCMLQIIDGVNDARILLRNKNQGEDVEKGIAKTMKGKLRK